MKIIDDKIGTDPLYRSIVVNPKCDPIKKLNIYPKSAPVYKEPVQQQNQIRFLLSEPIGFILTADRKILV